MSTDPERERQYAETSARAGEQIEAEVRDLLLRGICKTRKDAMRLHKECRPDLWREYLQPHLTSPQIKMHVAEPTEHQAAGNEIARLATDRAASRRIDFPAALQEVKDERPDLWRSYMTG
jgi:hypothetical protein